jgi:anti-sigma factor RsiW
MKAKLSEQDLTDYALNALEPDERLYVESMLAVSEDDRNDIYAMIDTALMLEEGFEREDDRQPVLLMPEQRERLLNVRVPNRFLHHAAGILAAAASVAFALVHKDVWIPKGPASEVARVSGEVSSYVAQAVSAADGDDFANQFANFRRLTEDPVLKKWFSSQPVGGSATFGGGSSFGLEVSPRATLDFMP